jgi:UDP-N-acetylglucosamine diphosphorylase / glucose-1-phosphate thymidylyltransferase / UDP-N-acetylgalactosamine diphosphorylase / glucosamine-1-phosphate N-acetyltransferase / galactosamine-1-phosphate N-acetyltransferase
MTNLILTMAGKYERFRLFGNKIPKYLMPLGSRTILWHVIDNILLSNMELDIFLIANKRDIEFEPIVKSVMVELGIPSKNIQYIEDTNSQLETAMKASNLIDEKKHVDKIVFTNIDTLLIDRCNYFNKITNLNQNEGLIDVFDGDSHEYSYAKIQNEKVIKVVDRLPISQYACSGLYGFGSGLLFFQKAKELLSQNNKHSFTEIYNKYLQEENSVYFNHNSNKNQTIVLGTPEEYVTNLHKIS